MTRKAKTVAKTSSIRTRLAQVVWLAFVLAALFLAVGALLISIGAERENALVEFVLDGARLFDLGVFSLHNGIKEFSGENSDTKNALFNWGLAAVLWLVVGRLVERIIRP